jgi:hypothetical protein
MQIYELTSGKRKLKEYDPSRSPPDTPNYATGVGPGVKSQMTATPTASGSSTVTPAPASTPSPANTPDMFAGATDPVDVANRITARQTADARPEWKRGKQQPAEPTMSAPAATPDYSGGRQTVTPTLKTPPASTPAPTPAPATPNFGTGVGPGAKSQMTATPTVSGASTVAPTPAAAPAQSAATPAPAASPSQPTYNVPLANVPTQPAMMPTNMSATGNPVASPAAGIDPELAAAGKVKMGAPQGRKADIGGAIANAMQAYNANKVGLGYLLPKDAKNEVYTDSTGKITIDGKPYDAANPAHQRLVGKITIGGKPYNGANPEHRAAYLAFKNTAGKGGRDTVKIDANGKVTVLGQPFDPSNPAHVQQYRQHVLGSSVAQTPPPAPPPQQPAAQQPPAAQGSPDVVQALTKLGYTDQQAAAMAAKVPPGTDTQAAIKLGLAGKLNESLVWSRSFDPSSTLLKKMKSQS